MGEDAAAEADRLLAGPIDWDRLLHLAREQAVVPLVARQLASRYRERVPSAALQRIEVEARALGADSLALTGVLLELVDAFERARIGVLPFKGPTLALQAYRDPGLRTFADLDLLVRPADLDRARTLLLDDGFRPTYPSTPARRALLVRRGSHETFERGSATVELHWRIASPVSDFRLDYERLWARLGSISIAGRELQALPPDDLLLVLTLHGTKHAWERLAWICDIAELLRARPDLDWDSALSEASRMRCSRALRLAVALPATLLGAPLPPAVAAAARADGAVTALVDRVRGELFLPPRAGAGTFGYHLATRASWRDKVALALGSLTALNQRDLEALPLPDAALPLYFLARPARLAGKALAHTLRRRAP
jgi:hypothetical protein